MVQLWDEPVVKERHSVQCYRHLVAKELAQTLKKHAGTMLVSNHN